MNTQEESIEELVSRYFSFGFQQKEILAFLKHLHNISISLRTLKRILYDLNLYRRKKYSSMLEILTFVEGELAKSGQLHGYRWMHLRCLQNNLVVTQDIVRELILYLDPRGVELRKRKRLRRRQYFNKGPNFLWHMDSYDKLKPYGICINGCVDGFSRHIMWLCAGSTSSDPKVIAGYYVNGIQLIGGCPKTIRCDMGTENKTVEKIQTSLNELFDDHNPAKPPFLYGKSVNNQRIESWWSILRKHSAQFWMNLFQMLKEDDCFDGSFLDKSLVQFCFTETIQKDLDQVVLEWNVHKIRKSRNSISPVGRPAVMFEIPSLYDTRSYLVNIPDFAIDAVRGECTFLKYPCDKDFYDLCNIFMFERGYIRDNDPYKTVDLYIALRQLLKDAFQ